MMPTSMTEVKDTNEEEKKLRFLKFEIFFLGFQDLVQRATTKY